MEKYIMSFDAGTTSERAIIFNKNSEIVSVAQKEIAQIYPNPGWVEHNPMEIWSAQVSVAVEAMAKAGISAEQIEAIGITNQRETTIVWDKKTGLPIYNAIVWQCRRTSSIVEEVRKDGLQDYIKENTGYALLFGISFALTILVSKIINVNNIVLELVFNIIICLVIPNIIYYLTKRKSQEYAYLIGIAKNIKKRKS